jgi:hypothetical protein
MFWSLHVSYSKHITQANHKLTYVPVGDILEAGAYYSVRIKDIASFERYIAQLNTYYHDLAYVFFSFV